MEATVFPAVFSIVSISRASTASRTAFGVAAIVSSSLLIALDSLVTP